MKILLPTILAVTSTFASSMVSAEPATQDKFYLGAGVAINSLDRFDDATGLQVFAGMDLPFVWANANHSVEVGYMDSGDFDLNGPAFASTSAQGLWASYNLGWSVYDNVNLFVRGGFDAGDDDGVLLGVGAEYEFNAPVRLRLELVERDHIGSIQLNIAYRL